MSWSTIRETLIRRFCPAIAQDTTTWADLVLQAIWDDAATELKIRLCPPFTAAQFDTLNNADTNTATGNQLIAEMAVLRIYRDLPGVDPLWLRDKESEMDKKLAELQDGDRSVFLSTGSRMSASEIALSHNKADVQPTFTLTERDSDGTIIGDSGSLDQFQ